jgi:hypothetical protein
LLENFLVTCHSTPNLYNSSIDSEKDYTMNFNADGNPTVTALYLVDRDKQGKYYRWFNAETGQWGRCGADMNEALEGKDQSAVGFFPWVGPLTGPNIKASKPIAVVTEDEPVTKAPKAAKKRMAKATAAPKTVKVKESKATHPDGTVFYRADRGKWIAMWAGKQEAARPTAEACLAFLQKKYNHVGTVIPKE